jgi:hypothetical protein
MWWKYCMRVDENGKVRPVETLPGMGAEGIKEKDGGGEFNYDIFKNFCKKLYLQYNNNKNIFSFAFSGH